MKSECKSSNIDCEQNLNDREHNYEIKFLATVLWELGHPEEPDETLVEVLENENGRAIIPH